MRKAFFILLSLFNAGCITSLRPEGDWSRPVHLALYNDSLAGYRIRVECFAKDMDEETSGKTCAELAKALSQLGADVLSEEDVRDEEEEGKKEERPHDFRIRYVDHESSADFCGWTLPFFLLSFTVFPCVADLRLAGELQLFDRDDFLNEKKILRTRARRVIGAAALPMLMLRLFSATRERPAIYRARLWRYVQNSVVTFVRRQEMEEGPRLSRDH